MRAGGVAVLTMTAALAGWSGAAQAYRPFDGTDAAVAQTGEIEIELGPIEYLREGEDRTLFAPDYRVNYGFASGWEASVEGKAAYGLSGGVPGAGLIESDVLLKRILREGALQEKPGPSIATEFGILLPGINDEPGTGAVLTGAASQRWDWGTVHLNAQIELTREQHAIIFSIRSSRVRTTGSCGRSPNFSMNGILACFGPIPRWWGRSGKYKTISQSISRCAERSSMATLWARSAPA
jgi:hypothetical protein